MRKVVLILTMLCISLMFTGCSMFGSENSSTQIATFSTEVTLPTQKPATPIIDITDTPPVFPTEAQTLTPTPFTPFTATVWADNVNVRTNPGYLFPSKRQLAKDTQITILGKAPGGEWMYARVPGGIEGWVFAQLVQSNIDLQSVPLLEPKDVLLIKGHVADSAGIPIQGVGFSIYKGTTDTPAANHVLSDAEGNFYSFMPTSALGDWLVVQDSIACASNVWTDNSCSTYKGSYTGQVEPQSSTVTLPKIGILEFLWR